MTAFPARVGGIFGWEYYPFPPNFSTQLVFPAHAGVSLGSVHAFPTYAGVGRYSVFFL